jgi:hypothetical protein
MGVLNSPEEVVLKIFSQLGFSDIANLRLVNKRFSEIGRDALITQIHFHCSESSFNRLSQIAQHAVFHKHVDGVIFEGNMLASIGCSNEYVQWYPNEPWENELPPPLHPDATDRERRLYDRNVSRATKERKKRHSDYQELYMKQQNLVSSTAYNDFVDTSMARFPLLRKLTLSTAGRCRHVLSPRFFESYPLIGPLSIDQETKCT